MPSVDQAPGGQQSDCRNTTGHENQDRAQARSTSQPPPLTGGWTLQYARAWLIPLDQTSPLVPYAPGTDQAYRNPTPHAAPGSSMDQ